MSELPLARAAAAPAGGPLVVRTVPVPDPGPLVSRLPDATPYAWMRRGSGLVGWGEAARIETSGPGRFAAAEQAWSALVEHAVVRDEICEPGSGPVAFGSFGFADEAGRSVLVLPAFVLGRRGDRWWATTATMHGDLPPLADLPPDRRPPRSPGAVSYADGALSGPAWTETVRHLVDRIATGEADKVVLARDLEARAEGPVDPRWLLRRLAERYPRCWTFAVDGLVGATPELLVRREQGLVTSRVLAGTIRRTGDDEHDLALAASLARSSKDLEEHEYAVRSVADALAPHCSAMNVPEAPFVLHLANVMHLATDVTGVLSDAATSLSLAAALHPSAAVAGTPTPVALRLIAELEGMDRDRYAGPVGWLDALGDGEWGIALRCAQLDPADPRRLRLFAGCGIVGGSDPEAELAESAAKLVAVRDALGP